MKNSAEQTLKDFYTTYEIYAKSRNHKSLLRRAVKLAEETGEVSEAVLAVLGSESKVRKIKQESGQDPSDHLAEELGDVIITALHVAHVAGLDKLDLFRKATTKMRKKIKDILPVADSDSKY